MAAFLQTSGTGCSDDFITEDDTVDDCFWMERHVIGNPRLCCRQLRERRDITIIGSDSDGDASVGEGGESLSRCMKKLGHQPIQGSPAGDEANAAASFIDMLSSL